MKWEISKKKLIDSIVNFNHFNSPNNWSQVQKKSRFSFPIDFLLFSRKLKIYFWTVQRPQMTEWQAMRKCVFTDQNRFYINDTHLREICTWTYANAILHKQIKQWACEKRAFNKNKVQWIKTAECSLTFFQFSFYAFIYMNNNFP